MMGDMSPPCLTYRRPLWPVLAMGSALALLGFRCPGPDPATALPPAGSGAAGGNGGDGGGVDAVCGDEVLRGDEECDDGGLDDGDGCDASCLVEDGYDCGDDEPSECETICGDGIVVGDEQCDDGDTEQGDGCSPGCTVEPGFECDSSEPSECVGFFWATRVEAIPENESYEAELYVLRLDGAAELIAPLAEPMEALAVVGGTLYGATGYYSSNPGMLYEIDPQTGALSNGVKLGESTAFVVPHAFATHNGTVIGIIDQGMMELASVDVSTGTLENLSFVQDFVSTLASDGTDIFGMSHTDLYQVLSGNTLAPVVDYRGVNCDDDSPGGEIGRAAMEFHSGDYYLLTEDFGGERTIMARVETEPPAGCDIITTDLPAGFLGLARPGP